MSRNKSHKPTPKNNPAAPSQPETPHSAWLRPHRQGAAEPSNVELFFDLVYALAVTQLTHYLLEHQTARGAGETMLLLLIVWLGWINTIWITNYFNLGRLPIRLLLLWLMLVSLVMSASLPDALNGKGILFAVAFVVLLNSGTGFLWLALGRRHHLSAVLERVLIWWLLIGILWLVGAFVGGDLRLLLWTVAILLSSIILWLGFPIPGLGRSHTSDYTISGEHLALRCHLFIILALGESVLITGANFGALPTSLETTIAFLIAFIGAVTLWWIYFDRGAQAAIEVISASPDPGRIGIYAFTYFHIPMVAGIIVSAAADDLVLAHPSAESSVVTVLVIVGGPLLFLVGNSLYKNSLWGHVPRSRYIAIAALVLLFFIGMSTTVLVVAAAATVIILLIAWSGTFVRLPTPNHPAG